MTDSMGRGDTVEDDPRRPGPSASSRRAGAVLGLGLLAIFAAASWLVFTARGPRTAAGRPRAVSLLGIDRPFPAEGRFASDPYIGSRACSECHPGESALQSRSGH